MTDTNQTKTATTPHPTSCWKRWSRCGTQRLQAGAGAELTVPRLKRH